MPDDPNKPGPPDSRRVNIHEEHELDYWTKEFGVSKEELIKAVDAVGTSAEEVKKYLKK
jgi:hypothetical protein